MSIISSIRNMISRYLMPRVFLNWSDQDIVLKKEKKKKKLEKKKADHMKYFIFMNC